MKIAVLNYGVGNLKSIVNALASLPCDVALTNDAGEITSSDKLVLPGVGAFAYCMEQLVANGLDSVVRQEAASHKPMLGICVGMQMLFDSSDEHGSHRGLGLIPGAVKKLPVQISNEVRLPHIGWNRVTYNRVVENKVFAELPNEEEYYFVHSYACMPENSEHVLARASYADVDFTAAVLRKSICGVQYHPERSGPAGLALLNNFVRH